MNAGERQKAISEDFRAEGYRRGQHDARIGNLWNWDACETHGEDFAAGYRAGWYDVEGRVPREAMP